MKKLRKTPGREEGYILEHTAKTARVAEESAQELYSEVACLLLQKQGGEK